MDEAGTIAAVIARLDFLERRVTALETTPADIVVTMKDVGELTESDLVKAIALAESAAPQTET